LVIENEQEEAEIVWFLVDASVDSCSGTIGQSPLDAALDQVAESIEAHLMRGDRVGVALAGARPLAFVPPGRGPKHKARLMTALTDLTHTADADRSDWDEQDIFRRAREHAASIDDGASQIPPHDVLSLSEVLKRLLSKAPAKAPTPWATTAVDRLFRRYLLSFGIQPPPRGTSDRHMAERVLSQMLGQVQKERPRPTLIYVYASPPSFESPIEYMRALRSVPKRRTRLRFVPLQEGLAAERGIDPKERIAIEALSQRQKVQTARGLVQLRQAGIAVKATAKPTSRL
jgi:uncharacterized protein (DUF58 family)